MASILWSYSLTSSVLGEEMNMNQNKDLYRVDITFSPFTLTLHWKLFGVAICPVTVPSCTLMTTKQMNKYKLTKNSCCSFQSNHLPTIIDGYVMFLWRHISFPWPRQLTNAKMVHLSVFIHCFTDFETRNANNKELNLPYLVFNKEQSHSLTCLALRCRLTVQSKAKSPLYTIIVVLYGRWRMQFSQPVVGSIHSTACISEHNT